MISGTTLVPDSARLARMTAGALRKKHPLTTYAGGRLCERIFSPCSARKGIRWMPSFLMHHIGCEAQRETPSTDWQLLASNKRISLQIVLERVKGGAAALAGRPQWHALLHISRARVVPPTQRGSVGGQFGRAQPRYKRAGTASDVSNSRVICRN